MTEQPREVCVGVFTSRQRADAAVEELRVRGFGLEDVSVVARGRSGIDRFGGWDEAGEIRPAASHDMSAGQGAALGGIAGLLIGAGLMLVPGVGPLFAAGPLAAGLAGAVTGAVTGGLTSALIEVGVHEEEAREYEGRVREGAYLVVVTCFGEAVELAHQILKSHDAEAIHEHRIDG